MTLQIAPQGWHNRVWLPTDLMFGFLASSGSYEHRGMYEILCRYFLYQTQFRTAVQTLSKGGFMHSSASCPHGRRVKTKRCILLRQHAIIFEMFIAIPLQKVAKCPRHCPLNPLSFSPTAAIFINLGRRQEGERHWAEQQRRTVLPEASLLAPQINELPVFFHN